MDNWQFFRFHKGYFALTVLLFAVEVLIALYEKNNFIRSYFGDFLVVILMYCFCRSFFHIPVFKTALVVLLFSYVIEVLQYVNLLSLLGLQNSKPAKIILGNSFSWHDILAYTLGVLIVLFTEKIMLMKAQN